MKYRVLVFVTLLTSIILPAQAENISKHLVTIAQPKPIERVAPRYPMNATKNGREGWERVSFVIEKDGSINPHLRTVNPFNNVLTLYN